MTTLQEIQSENNKHKRKVLIGRYLNERIEYYERQVTKSSDMTQCDNVDWVVLASDMFDTLEIINHNFLIL